MAAKIVPIPAHIVSSGDDTGYYNIVNDVNNRIGDISRSGNNMLISNIRLSRIRTVIGGSSYNLGSLLSSSTINTNSFYRTNKASPHGVSEMAGYNHLAKPSTYFASNPNTLSSDILEDGSNFKITISTQLRRGERIPAYGGYVASWNNIKIVLRVYEKSGLIQGALLQTRTVTGVNVTRMFSSAINSIDVPMPNTTTEYWLDIKAYYTYNTTDREIEDSIRAVLTTTRIYDYSLISSGTLVRPFEQAQTYSFDVKNNAPETSNSKSYIGQFRVKFTYYFSSDATSLSNSYALSSYDVSVSPQQTKSVTCTFDPQVTDVDELRAMSITVYYLKNSSWVELDSKTWS